MLGAGLPQLRGNMGRAKSYAERLFEFPEIGALSDHDARRAIAKPAQAEGVTINDAALDAIIVALLSLQEVAERSPITAGTCDRLPP